MTDCISQSYKDFMIQTRSNGNWLWRCRIQVKDEFSDLRFDNSGFLAMLTMVHRQTAVNFITHVATPWLDGKHIYFHM
jgi:cyclophilin family peptidyl-prolyl cis-trans isomerase